MIERRLIRHEIEHQLEVPIAKATAQAGERRVTTKARMHRVAGDRKPRPGDVLFPEIGQGLFELVPPFGIAARRLLTGGTGLPDAQQPDPVESHSSEAI